jgi:hypothetical protein
MRTGQLVDADPSREGQRWLSPSGYRQSRATRQRTGSQLDRQRPNLVPPLDWSGSRSGPEGRTKAIGNLFLRSRGDQTSSARVSRPRRPRDRSSPRPCHASRTRETSGPGRARGRGTSTRPGRERPPLPLLFSSILSDRSPPHALSGSRTPRHIRRGPVRPTPRLDEMPPNYGMEIENMGLFLWIRLTFPVHAARCLALTQYSEQATTSAQGRSTALRAGPSEHVRHRNPCGT